MSDSLVYRLSAELAKVRFVDPHSHINPLSPASRSLADMLGYHYYTELVHSAGISRDAIEGQSVSEEERITNIVEGLSRLSNTIQYQWLLEISRELFGFKEASIRPDNWRALADLVTSSCRLPEWESTVLARNNMEAVFLTNDFDDLLSGFDTSRYVPCLRVDELVFHSSRPGVLDRLSSVTGIVPSSSRQLEQSITCLTERFVRAGARAAAISLPPNFRPERIDDSVADRAIEEIRSRGEESSLDARDIIARHMFWVVAGSCNVMHLPFDLMIGVRRGVYPGGVYQGQDLLDGRLSLADYAPLFNAFPKVVFPVSVLSHPLNHELTAFAWIFPNVMPFGHWWYANTPTVIERDLEQRIEAVPRTKLLGYYSDMYKLEFGYPKFAMYRRVLSRVLARRFVLERNWSEEAALDLGVDLLARNTRRIFYGSETVS
ncbi:MAG: amidohydrolase [Planctomycetaceae bacterium]